MKINLIQTCVLVLLITGLVFEIFTIMRVKKSTETIKAIKIRQYETDLKFLLIGDFGDIHPYNNSNYVPLVDLAGAMSSFITNENISMILSAGDNFYSESNIDYILTISKIMNLYLNSPALSSIPWFLLYGNHDCYFSNSHGSKLEALYSQVFMREAPWNMTLHYPDFSVSFTFLPCDLICYGPVKSYRTEKQCNDMRAVNNNFTTYKWLARHFYSINQDTRIKWKIVLIHSPVFSISTSGSDSESLKQYLLPLLKKYKIDLILSGHNHNMQYLAHNLSTPDYQKQVKSPECMRPSHLNCGEYKVLCESRNSSCPALNKTCADRVSMEEGVEYRVERFKLYRKGEMVHQVVQGAGGATLDPLCPKLTSPMAEVVFGKSAHGLSYISVNSSHVSIKFVDSVDSSILFESVIAE